MADKLIIIGVIASLLASIECGPTNFATGGQNAVQGQYPSIVGINFQENRFCAGVVLNENHVLTAGSCVLNANRHLVAANQVQIRAGNVLLMNGAPRINVISVYVHPMYNPYSFHNDIAVLRTATNFVFLTNVVSPDLAPAIMNNRIVPDGSDCQFAGWNIGLQAEPPLQSLVLSVRNRDDCNMVNLNGTVMQESSICTSTMNPLSSGVCLSNRGGGLFCNGHLTGILSNGFGCGSEDVPAVFTQVRYFDTWIEEQFLRTDIPVAGPTPQPGIDGNNRGAANPLYGASNLIIITIIIQMLRFMPIKF